MKKECKFLNTCGFFRKYESTRDLACRGFIILYCKGEKMKACKRLEYKEKNQKPPSDDLMPNGGMCKSKEK